MVGYLLYDNLVNTPDDVSAEGLAALWGAMVGAVVVQRPRLSHFALIPFLVILTADAGVFEQGPYVLLLVAVIAYSAPATVTLVCGVAVAGWLVVWAAAGDLGVAELPVTVLLFMLCVVPGLTIRQLSRRLVATDEALAQRMVDERKAVARELHDVVAHELTVIAMQARVAERSQDPDVRDESLRAVGDHARDAITELGRLLQALRAEQAVGEASEEWAADSVGAGAPVSFFVEWARQRLIAADARVEVDLQGDPEEIPSGLRPTVRALLLEGTTNAIKHGGAGMSVRLSLETTPDIVRVGVRNTTSAPLRLPPSGFGLTGLRERVATLGGTMVAGLQGAYFELRAELPRRS
ncbi:sensor histidine kinase [Serinicoccus sp. CUA-874]|uniref:sensor histidine kinase n=1 Tax=Serinicoccus sp. CUA-874 TaxID=1517939 RepID=UPI00117991D8|nr:histidine kinase [Serinicoccus sp. CUA-874]